MQRKLLGEIALIVSVSLFTIAGNAQDSAKNVKQKIVDENGTPSLITFNEKSTYKTSDSQKVFTDQLGLKTTSNFSKTKSETDKLGFSHEKFQLYHFHVLRQSLSQRQHQVRSASCLSNGQDE